MGGFVSAIDWLMVGTEESFENISGCRVKPGMTTGRETDGVGRCRYLLKFNVEIPSVSAFTSSASDHHKAVDDIILL